MQIQIFYIDKKFWTFEISRVVLTFAHIPFARDSYTNFRAFFRFLQTSEN